MKRAALKLVSEAGAAEWPSIHDHAPLANALVGRVVHVGEDGVPRVDYPGNPHGPLAAALALSAADGERLARGWERAEVLIVFASGDSRQPVITGLIRRSFDDLVSDVADWEGFERLFLRAKEELVLACGQARIVLRRDGKLTIIGREVLSRALERNRIRGATVDIN